MTTTTTTEIASKKEERGEERTGEENGEIDYSKITEMDLELKSFKCPRCELVFETTNDLFVHMRDTYSDPTVCQLCGKNLNCMANVLSHSYLHQGIKPYKCPKCKYATRTRFNLRVHFGSCAKIEKFSYKRGTGTRKRKMNNGDNQRSNKRRRTSNYQRNRNNKRSMQLQQNDINGFVVSDNNNNNNIQYQQQQNNINSIIYNDDIRNQLPDSGPPTNQNRDTSCLIQVHLQHFPRPNQVNNNIAAQQQQQIGVNNSTNRYYQQNNNNNNNNNNTNINNQIIPQQQPPTNTDISQFYNNIPPQTQQQQPQEQAIPYTITDIPKEQKPQES